MREQDPTIKIFLSCETNNLHRTGWGRGRSRIWIFNKASMQNQAMTVSSRKINGRWEFWGLLTGLHYKTPVSDKRCWVLGETQGWKSQLLLEIYISWSLGGRTTVELCQGRRPRGRGGVPSLRSIIFDPKSVPLPLQRQWYIFLPLQVTFISHWSFWKIFNCGGAGEEWKSV